jgi:glycogenin glucosyltransferase
MQHSYPVPDKMKQAGGRSRFAFVTFLMLNDSYLAGALVLAYALRKQKTAADLVCLVTDEITPGARSALGLLFDHVVDVESIFVPHKRRQQRQDRPYFFTRVNVLRLGEDGDLGLAYDKIAVLDADLLPLRHYDHLFTINAPAGILNERRSHVMEYDTDGTYVIPPSVAIDGTWKWHRIYDAVCPHGHPIPPEITDQVKTDATNMGLNGSLFVLEPSMAEFDAIVQDVRQPEMQRLVGDQFDWPDMQYLTARWSGKWTSIDVRFSGFSGYPNLSVLFGTHYAGFKPWSFKKRKAMARWGRYEDFQFWFHSYASMIEAHPRLRKVKRLDRLLREIKSFTNG